MGYFCSEHMPPGHPRNGHMLSGSRDCQVQHADCRCANWPEFITKGCPQHLPYRERTD